MHLGTLMVNICKNRLLHMINWDKSIKYKKKKGKFESEKIYTRWLHINLAAGRHKYLPSPTLMFLLQDEGWGCTVVSKHWALCNGVIVCNLQASGSWYNLKGTRCHVKGQSFHKHPFNLKELWTSASPL